MKNSFLGTVIVLCALAACSRPDSDPAVAQAAATQSAASDVKFQALNVGAKAEADGTVPVTTELAPQDDIVASVATRGAAKDATIEVKLVRMADASVLSTQQSKISPDGDTTTNLTFKKTQDWQPGRYLVEARVDGKLGASQQVDVRSEPMPSSDTAK